MRVTLSLIHSIRPHTNWFLVMTPLRSLSWSQKNSVVRMPYLWTATWIRPSIWLSSLSGVICLGQHVKQEYVVIIHSFQHVSKLYPTLSTIWTWYHNASVMHNTISIAFFFLRTAGVYFNPAVGNIQSSNATSFLEIVYIVILLINMSKTLVPNNKMIINQQQNGHSLPNVRPKDVIDSNH